jgi:hypothetical protein
MAVEQGHFEVTSEAEATATLDYFNGFHDGFMKRIVIVSRDEMTDDPGQTCSGVFDVEIDFAHYNYQAHGRPLQPHTQIVRGTFEGVQDVALELSQGFVGNSILSLAIESDRRRMGGTTSEEPCLALHLARNYLIEEERRWELRKAVLFTFTRAGFREG